MPGEVFTAYDLRFRRAVKMVLRGFVPTPTRTIGEYKVPSASGERNYTVYVDRHGDVIAETRCTCPDWRNMNTALIECLEHPCPGMPGGVHPGVAHIDYSPFCKHVGLVLLSIGHLKMPVYAWQLRRELAAQPVAV